MHARHCFGLVLIVAPLLTGCSRGVDLQAADKPNDRPALETRLKQLLTDRVETARKARAATLAAFQADTVPFSDLITATDNLWKAQVALATKTSDFIAAHKAHVENCRRTEQGIYALYQVGARGGEAEKEATARFARESAEIALLEACIGTGQPYPVFDASLGIPVKREAAEE